MIDHTTVRPTRLSGVFICTLLVLGLVLPTGLIAISLGLGAGRLPYQLLLVRQRLPAAFPLHMIASGSALILVPIAAFVRRYRDVHRTIGRAASLAVIAGALSAVPVALASEAPAMARVGFVAQALTWIGLLIFALLAIVRGIWKRHARLMLAMAAVTSGAIWLRVVLAIATLTSLPFEATYAAAAWACWLVPLAIVAVSFRPRAVTP